MVVTIRPHKNVNSSGNEFSVSFYELDGPECAIRWVVRMVELRGAFVAPLPESDARRKVFRIARHRLGEPLLPVVKGCTWTAEPMHTNDINTEIRGMLRHAGVPTNGFSVQSFRKGYVANSIASMPEEEQAGLTWGVVDHIRTMGR